MAGVSREALTRFGHEAGSDSVFRAETLDNVSTERISRAIITDL